MAGYIDIMKLPYQMQLFTLPISSVLKKILIVRYCMHVYCEGRLHYGPLWTFICLSKEYGLYDIVKNAIEHNVLVCKNEWKRLVKSRVWEKYLRNILNNLKYLE